MKDLPAESLIKTKLNMPRPRRQLVPRPGLFERLDAIFSARLALVAAPAGYGKTTLVASWLADLEASSAGSPVDAPAVCWLSLEESDDEPARFFTYFLASLRGALPQLGEVALGALQSAQLPPQTLVTPALNALEEAGREVVVVLDDYQAISARYIQEGIVFFAEHLPPMAHLVVITRADPPFPLARWRARGEMVELRQHDLRWTGEETAAFANEVMGLELPSEAVGTIERRTEGWPAGVQLAALALQGQSAEQQEAMLADFDGTQRYVVDFLMEEVWQRQPERLRSFLLQTAVLDRLTASLCNAVTGEEDGQAMLEEVRRGNLFLMPLDDRRRWYRYHRLFAGTLRQRLADDRPEWIPELYRRAALWHTARDEVDEAMGYALEGGEMEVAAQILEEHAGRLLATGGWNRLLAWCGRLPEHVLGERPGLALYYAWGLVFAQQFDEAESRLAPLEAMVSGFPAGRADEATAYLGQASAVRGWLATTRGDVAGAEKHSNRALELVPRNDLLTRGIVSVALGIVYRLMGRWDEAGRLLLDGQNLCARAGNSELATIAAATQAQVLEARGRLAEAAGIYRRLLRENRGRLDGALAALHLSLGLVLYEWNDLAGAGERLNSALDVAGQVASVDNEAVAIVSLARLLVARGEADRAAQTLSRLEAERFQSLAPAARGRLEAMAIPLYLDADPGRALRRLRETESLASAELRPADFMAQPEAHVGLARLLLWQNRDREALAYLEGMQELVPAVRLADALSLLALLALARARLGDSPGALASLDLALELAEPGGYVRTFADLGPELADLLVRMPAGERRDTLLGAFASHSDKELQSVASSPEELAEPLNEREQQILRLMAAGLSNPEIARELYLATNTVKWYAKSAYGKLGVHSRIEAVNRARELGLL